MHQRSSERCPCGSGQAFQICCQPFINGSAIPSSPEQLMRSRYSAYTQADVDYIQLTMCGPAAIGYNPAEAKRWASSVQWQQLQVIQSAVQGDEGQVEFMANYISDGHPNCLHEYSLFQRINGRWFYIKALPLPKRGRNALCICGSGKKNKRCCQK